MIQCVFRCSSAIISGAVIATQLTGRVARVRAVDHLERVAIEEPVSSCTWFFTYVLSTRVEYTRLRASATTPEPHEGRAPSVEIPARHPAKRKVRQAAYGWCQTNIPYVSSAIKSSQNV
jgi:hypothetical protein